MEAYNVVFNDISLLIQAEDYNDIVDVLNENYTACFSMVNDVIYFEDVECFIIHVINEFETKERGIYQA